MKYCQSTEDMDREYNFGFLIGCVYLFCCLPTLEAGCWEQPLCNETVKCEKGWACLESKCFRYKCQRPEQAYLISKNEVGCDCTDSDFTGDHCECPMPATPPPTLAINCTFENRTLCDFLQFATDDFDWTGATNRSTSSADTGPDRDHTTGAGTYIYIETSYPRTEGERAVLSSVIQNSTPSGGQCLSFWYHMFGADIGTLNVYLTTQPGNKTIIWSRSKTQGNVWKNGLRTVKSTAPFTIQFEGIVGSSLHGDIALDDISLTQVPCPSAT